MKKHFCSLCKGETVAFFTSAEKKIYNKCRNCGSVLLLPQFFIASDPKKKRYLLHNNDVTDKRYRNFVRPYHFRDKRGFPPR